MKLRPLRYCNRSLQQASIYRDYPQYPIIPSSPETRILGDGHVATQTSDDGQLPACRTRTDDFYPWMTQIHQSKTNGLRERKGVSNVSRPCRLFLSSKTSSD
ncbi:hypothetical protein BDN71DRAFT_313794 [Pleurotus eryngii]|uniref:Uncharacterized protein n=1 Tax=Pleurotus eryngii TaxID=5323 RepID=A0A9P6DBR8_PLEER|nr:hypothetical protein BDN71DRAFT_313794 [Pleurotus eryngii]